MIKKTISFLIVFLLVVTPAMAVRADVLVPIGHTTGIKMLSKGVIVVGTTEVVTNEKNLNPSAGIKKGDVITKINGITIDRSEDFQKIVRQSKGESVKLTVLHGEKEKQFLLTPVKDTEGEYKLGIWVRDSMAGIGTITFYDPQSKMFGALGHGICDSDTGVLIPFKSGTVMESTVDEVKKGVDGEPGELKGNYNLSEDYGTLLDNTNFGIFGKVDKGMKFLKGNPLQVAEKRDVKCGPATILSNIEEDNVEEYKIEIVKIYPSDENDTKNMMIKITDEKLIEKTGGIVQGMSGSPIIQNGKLVGAVTHVLVNDPTRGYGIFIENMLDAAK